VGRRVDRSESAESLPNGTEQDNSDGPCSCGIDAVVGCWASIASTVATNATMKASMAWCPALDHTKKRRVHRRDPAPVLPS